MKKLTDDIRALGFHVGPPPKVGRLTALNSPEREAAVRNGKRSPATGANPSMRETLSVPLSDAFPLMASWSNPVPAARQLDRGRAIAGRLAQGPEVVEQDRSSASVPIGASTQHFTVGLNVVDRARLVVENGCVGDIRSGTDAPRRHPMWSLRFFRVQEVVGGCGAVACFR